MGADRTTHGEEVATRGDSSLLSAALNYAARGFRVLPVHSVKEGVCSCPEVGIRNRPGGSKCTAKGKHPRLGAWEKLATEDAHQIRQWWASWPDSNIGIAMGGEARLVALDIDGAKGRKSLADLESRHGLLPVTLTSKSGRVDGGEHRIFRLPDEYDLAKVNKVGFAEGLDTRGNGAQIVVPPSIHSSGRMYRWEYTVQIVDMPRWLYDRILAGQTRNLRGVPSIKLSTSVAKSESTVQAFDLHDLRKCLVDYRKKLRPSNDPVDEERCWIVSKILDGDAFAVPGPFEGVTDLLRGRDGALNKAMSILSWRLPVEIPIEAAIEVIRPCIANMDCEPEGFDHWLCEAVDMFERASERRDTVYAHERETNQATLHYLNANRKGAGMAPLVEKLEEIAVVTSATEAAEAPAAAGAMGAFARRLMAASASASSDEGTSEDEGRVVADLDDDLAIIVAPGELPRMINDAVKVLAARDSNMYQRAGDLVTLVREPKQTEEFDEAPSSGKEAKPKKQNYNILLRPGTPRIRTVVAPLLVERLAAAATWVRSVKSKQKGAPPRWVELDPDMKTVASVLARKDWPGIRPLRGIIETPIFTPTYQIFTEPGYDPETTFVHLPSVVFDAVPENPTQEDAQAALRYLWTELFSDFPYRGIGPLDPADTTRELRFELARACPDAFAAVSLLLTILSRPAVRGAVPGVVFEASTQGSGKSLQINVVSLVATGRAASFATFPIGREGRPNEEELEKLLGSYALAGVQIVAFDNIKGLLGGPALEKVQTAVDSVALRVLGASDLRILPWSAVMAFSGNNMSMSEDTAQRNLLSRLESALEDPRSRNKTEFRHPDLLTWIEGNRPALVRAAFIILKAWAVAESKPDAGTMGSFEAWSAVVPSAILYAGGPNVLAARPKDGNSDDSESEAHATLLRMWPFTEAITAANVVKKLFDGEGPQQRNTPKNYMELRGAVRELTNTQEGKTPNPNGFGYVLRKFRDKIRGGLKLVGKPNRDGTVEWRVMKVA